MEEKNKITCPNCNKTGNYKVKPIYCAYCGKIIQIKDLNTHNK